MSSLHRQPGTTREVTGMAALPGIAERVVAHDTPRRARGTGSRQMTATSTKPAGVSQ